MLTPEIKFKDEDGFHYKHPERSCKRCLKYPCIDNMQILKSNFASYGCKHYEDVNNFNLCKN